MQRMLNTVWKFIGSVFTNGRSPSPLPKYLSHTNYCNRSKKERKRPLPLPVKQSRGLSVLGGLKQGQTKINDNGRMHTHQRTLALLCQNDDLPADLKDIEKCNSARGAVFLHLPAKLLEPMENGCWRLGCSKGGMVVTDPGIRCPLHFKQKYVVLRC